MNSEHFEKIKELIHEADCSGLLKEVSGLTGLSGAKLIGMLQRIAQYQGSINAGCYVEIGVFQGLTLISVASVLDETRAFGIDNFAQFDPEHKNQDIVRERMYANNLENVTLINMDYEDALERLEDVIGDTKIGTYFVDGPHDYRSQLVCLQLAKHYFSDLAVIIIDDCNYRHVRLANRDFLLANPDFKMIFEAYSSCHPHNMKKAEKRDAENGWWNGVNVLVYDPNNVLEQMLPPTLRDRCLYENEHLVHAAKYSFLAPEVLSLYSSLLTFRPDRAVKSLAKLLLQIRKANPELVGTYSSMNTFSESLPPSNYNPSLTQKVVE